VKEATRLATRIVKETLSGEYDTQVQQEKRRKHEAKAGKRSL
jgi:hypothetical protein